MRESRRFGMEELAQATKSFTSKSLIGTGKFGEVYKGLLQDGVVVAIKRRHGLPTQEFVNEVLIIINSLVQCFGYDLEFEHAYKLIVKWFLPGSVSIVYQAS